MVKKFSLRKILFWTHLVIGLAAGGVIAVVTFTGATMAFEKQVIAWAERDLRHVAPPAPDTPRLPLATILERVRTTHPDARPAGIVVSADPTAPLTLSLGRTGSLYVNPYTGEAQPSGAKELRAFFRLMLTWHRWLGVSAPPRAEPGAESARPESAEIAAARTAPEGEGERGPPAASTGLTARQFAGSVVGIATIVFLALSLSGLYLWWPRKWNWRTLKTTSLFNFKLSGKARDWNWHNVIGLWSTPLLIVITFTGLVMAYRPFAAWLYPRPEGQAAAGPGANVVTIPTPPPGAKLLGPDALLAVAQKEIPAWETITLRLANAQARGGGGRGAGGRAAPVANSSASTPPTENASPSPASSAGTEPAAPTRVRNAEGRGAGGGGARGGGEARSPQAASLSVREAGWSAMATTLQLDPYTGTVLRRTGLSDLSFRQAMRALNRTLHTGEAGGLFGQTLAFLACVGGLFLVYTGFALSFRRFFKRRPKLPPAAKSAVRAPRTFRRLLPRRLFPARAVASAQAVGSENHTQAGDRRGRDSSSVDPLFRATPVPPVQPAAHFEKHPSPSDL